jgi:hypothetical protein
LEDHRSILCAHALRELNYIEQVDGNRWCLTQTGIHSMQSCFTISNGRAVLERCADGVPLADMSRFQLVLELRAREWTWKQWVPPSGRTSKTLPIPAGYKVGDPKIWFSGVDVNRFYLLALLQAQDRSALGHRTARISIRRHSANDSGPELGPRGSRSRPIAL